MLTDLSPGMVRAARESLGSGQFSYSVADSQSLPFLSSHFDLVIANHMLYHVPDRGKTLSQIRHTLKPGGRLYASTVGEGHMREIDELLAKFDPALEAPRWPIEFTLENGGAQLADWFSSVELRLYEDSLQVTRAEPLAAYILSMSSLKEELKTIERETTLVEFLQKELEIMGVIQITKAMGMFVGEK